LPYKHVTFVSATSFRQPHSKDAATYTITPDPYFQQFKSSGKIDVSALEAKATYYRVKQNRENTDIASKKFDTPLVQPNNELFHRAMDVATSYFSYIRAGPKVDFEQNLNASSGKYWKERGYPKKKDLYEMRDGVLCPKKEFLERIWSTDTIPLNTCCNKDEYLPEEEVSSIAQGGKSKLRLFEIPDADHGLRQTMFLGGQNEKMCAQHEKHWIQYGMTKEYRGFNRLIGRLKRFTLRVEGDVSRYDKNCNMRIVYNIRSKHLLINGIPYTEWLQKERCDIPKEILDFMALYDYTRYYTEHPHVILPNGDIVVLATGNCSGSGATTGDNCIFHVVIKIYECFKMLVKIFGSEARLTKAEIDKYWDHFIYGDDFLSGFMHKKLGVSVEDYLANMRETYAEFGMELKPSASFHSESEEGGRVDPRHSFLGSYCGWSETFGCYVPIPRVEKIASSICYVPLDNSMSKAEFWIRSYVLAVHLIPVPELCNVALQYCKFLYDHPDFLESRTEIDDFQHEEGCFGDQSPFKTFRSLYLGFE